MEWWYVPVGLGLVVAGLGALYGLHRVCLWLEARGLLYYWHKRPGGSAAACFVPWQQMLEPGTRHVHHLKEEKRHHSEEDGGGTGAHPGETSRGEPSPTGKANRRGRRP
jgi:hypothetical protein